MVDYSVLDVKGSDLAVSYQDLEGEKYPKAKANFSCSCEELHLRQH